MIHSFFGAGQKHETSPYLFDRVYVEVTNVCNLHCAFCTPTSRPPTTMSPDFFAQCLRELHGLTKEICLHVLGEPLTHPDFSQLLTLCHQARLTINLTTNGTLIKKHHQEILQAPALRQINFSLQALDIHNERDRKIFNHILVFCQAALESRPALYINLRLWNLDSLYQPSITTQSGPLWDRLETFLQKPIPPIPKGRKSRCLVGRLYLHQDTRFAWPTSRQGNRRTQGFCHGLSTHVAILADGTVCPCCLDAQGELVLGNLHQDSLETILHSPQALAIRQGFAQGRLVADLCQHCTYCHRFLLPPLQKMGAP